VGMPPRPMKKAVTEMLTILDAMVAQMYVEERLAEANRERMLRSVERAYRGQRETLRTRMGRTLVRAGQRLEAAPAA
jgi:hypothetical protein